MSESDNTLQIKESAKQKVETKRFVETFVSFYSTHPELVLVDPLFYSMGLYVTFSFLGLTWEELPMGLAGAVGFGASRLRKKVIKRRKRFPNTSN